MKKILHREETSYSKIAVYEENGERGIFFTGHHRVKQSQIFLKDRNLLVSAYTKMVCCSLYLMRQPQSILVVGLGGGILPSAFTNILPCADIQVVEIDPAMVRLAKKYFYFEVSPKLRVAEEDGQAFIRRAIANGVKYDLVILDAYSQTGIPSHLVSIEFLNEVKEVMKHRGVLALNIYSRKKEFNRLSLRSAQVFGRHYVLKKGGKITETLDFMRRNRVILASMGELPSIEELQLNARLLNEKLESLGMHSSSMIPLFYENVG